MQHNSEFLYRPANSQQEEMMSLSFRISYKFRIKLQSSHDQSHTGYILPVFFVFSAGSV